MKDRIKKLKQILLYPKSTIFWIILFFLNRVFIKIPKRTKIITKIIPKNTKPRDSTMLPEYPPDS